MQKSVCSGLIVAAVYDMGTKSGLKLKSCLKLGIWVLAGIYLSACARSFRAIDSSLDLSSVSNATLNMESGVNVIPLQVGNCPGGYNLNEPCVSVTICTPGDATQCETIPDVLVDTGSYGLRIFASNINIALKPEVDASGNDVAECVPYASGDSQWGPVEVADVHLGGEAGAQMPIQVVDSQFSKRPSSCTNPELNPMQAGFNGILGVGPLVADCGSACDTTASNNVYYSCNAQGCNGIAINPQYQVSNPVADLANDNNGVEILLPSIPYGGAGTVNGFLVLGIGTQSNNTPASNVRVLAADAYGNFTTEFNGATYSSSYIDSGSNGDFFPAVSSTPDCSSTSSANGFFCPSSLLSLSAIQIGANQGTQIPTNFAVINADQAVQSGNSAFNDLSGDGAASFAWGLPFFYGRAIYFGFQGRQSPLGAGPFYAY